MMSQNFLLTPLIRLRKLLELRKQLQAFYSKMESAPLPDAVVPSKVEVPFLNKLKDVVNARLGDAERSTDDLCKAVFLSNTQVSRKLKALTGQTPSQFIRSIRLKKAMQLLKTSGLNISEIAYEAGFSDPNYFSRMFKQEYGKAPGEVRG